jgi:hypothetical protein
MELLFSFLCCLVLTFGASNISHKNYMESKKDKTAILLLILQFLLNSAYDTSFCIAFSKPGKKKGGLQWVWRANNKTTNLYGNETQSNFVVVVYFRVFFCLYLKQEPEVRLAVSLP